MAEAKKAAKPVEPAPEKRAGALRFRMSEGTREELARTGHAVDPFTGKTLTRDDL